MIRQIDEIETELIPQAVLKKSIQAVVRGLAEIYHAHDDLDHYEGASFQIVDGPVFAVRHYRGYPKDTATIYLDPEIRDLQRINNVILRIVSELHLAESDIKWQRRDDPDL